MQMLRDYKQKFYVIFLSETVNREHSLSRASQRVSWQHSEISENNNRTHNTEIKTTLETKEIKEILLKNI